MSWRDWLAGAFGRPPRPHDGLPDLQGCIRIATRGREGQVQVRLPTGTVHLYWELGGGDCVAAVGVPGVRAWLHDPALAPWPREALLHAIGTELARTQSPGARVEVSDGWLSLLR